MSTTNKLRVTIFVLLILIVITLLLKDNPTLAEHRYYWPRIHIRR